jgi:hypothetical protein
MIAPNVGSLKGQSIFNRQAIGLVDLNKNRGFSSQDGGRKGFIPDLMIH